MLIRIVKMHSLIVDVLDGYVVSVKVCHIWAHLSMVKTIEQRQEPHNLLSSHNSKRVACHECVFPPRANILSIIGVKSRDSSSCDTLLIPIFLLGKLFIVGNTNIWIGLDDKLWKPRKCYFLLQFYAFLYFSYILISGGLRDIFYCTYLMGIYLSFANHECLHPRMT